jgi:hypothetical protein
MIRRLLYVSILALFAAGLWAEIARSATTANNDSSAALIVFVEGGQVGNNSVEFIFMVGSTLHQASKFGGTLAISSCQNGQTEITMAHRTRHLSHGESLSLDKGGNLVWFMPTLPSTGGLNRLKVDFKLPQGKGGPTYCLRVTTLAYGGVLPGPLSSEYSIPLT